MVEKQITFAKAVPLTTWRNKISQIERKLVMRLPLRSLFFLNVWKLNR
jgi:hypothetical protein